MSAPPAVEWIAGPAASFEAALLAGREVRAAAVAAGASLPLKDLSRFYPSTMQDAVAVVHTRVEDNKKKAAQSKQKSKSKSGAPHTPSDSHYPGAKAGGGEPSAFWMYIEDYFRDFTQEDLRGLLPLLLDPREDPALRVPPCGRRLEDEREQQRRHAAAKAAAEAARAAALAASTRGGSEWDPGAGDPARQHSGMDGSPEAERRSSRLVSRHSKEEEARRQEQLEAQAAEAASVAEQAEAAAAAAAARAMAVVPLTASGKPARQLLDVLPEQRLAMLLEQLGELLRLSGEAPLSAAGRPSVAASLRRLAAAAASNGCTSELDEEGRVEVEDWLREQLVPLAARLGCQARVLPPWAKRLGSAPGGAAAAAEPGAGAGASAGLEAAAGDGEEGQQGGAGGAAELPAAKLAAAAYLHPYTELMLALPVQQHTVQAAVEVPAPEVLAHARQATLGKEEAAAAAREGGDDGGAAAAPEAATPAASLLTATPGSAVLLVEAPSVASLPALSEPRSQGGAAAAAGADTAATAHAAATPSLAAGAGEAAAGSMSGAATPAGAPLAAAGGDEGTQLAGGGGSQPARAGGRARGISNYALLAGKKSSSRSAAPPKKAARAAAARPEGDVGLQHPVARAVAVVVAAGEPDAPAAEQWRRGLERCPGLLAAAPEDEVLAEMLALQNELMQQAAANRARLAPALAGVLSEVQERRAAAQLRGREEEEVKAWIQKAREVKRQQQRQRREQAHAEALAAKRQSIMASPRPVLGRQRGHLLEVGEEEGEDSLQLAYSLGPEELYDVLAKRVPGKEDRCAVCAEADWVPTNQIVYCERCDVAVHQACYGIAAVPEGDWLCDPCRQHEEALRAQGRSETEIRPPGHQQRGDLLEGGAHACRCVLCPIKYGAFKRSEDGRHWVHSACALWVPETFLGTREVPGVGRQDYVGGLERVRQERWDGRCAVCGLAGAGAVVACQQPGGCPVQFHVLCARNIGLHLPIRADPSRKGALQYRIYCAPHSVAQRQRDDQAAQERRSRAAAAQQKESRARAAERLAADRAALAAREEERAILFGLRANMETSRMLTDMTKRRERLKKQLVVLQQQQWEQLRGADPEHALTWLQRAQRRRREAEAAAAAPVAPPALQAALGEVTGAPALGTLPALQQLPPFALPVPKQAQQASQQQVQAMFSQGGMASLPMPGGAGGLHFMPQLPLPQAQAPPLLVPQPPSFAVDMFAQQQQQHPQHPQQFFLQQQQQQHFQQLHHFQQQQQQQAPGSSAAFAFPGLPLQLPPPQQAGGAASLPPTSTPELPAAAGLLVNVPGSAAAAAQVPSDVAAAIFGAPTAAVPGMLPGMPLQAAQHAGGTARPAAPQAARAPLPAMPFGRVDPAVSAALRGQPSMLPGQGPPRLDLVPQQPQPQASSAPAAATPPPSSPLAAAALPGGSGRPKRAAAAALHSGGAKRLRAGSVEATPAVTPRAAQQQQQQAQQVTAVQPPPRPAFPPPQPPQAPVAETAGGAAAAAGRRQRVASIKVRENLLQRERQMTAEEAEALNARLPGPLRYLPAEELEAALGSPSARAARGAAQQQRQAKAARGRGGGYGGR